MIYLTAFEAIVNKDAFCQIHHMSLAKPILEIPINRPLGSLINQLKFSNEQVMVDLASCLSFAANVYT